MKNFVLHPVLYIIFFIAGVAVFFYLSQNVEVSVSVYRTEAGTVYDLKDGEAVMADVETEKIPLLQAILSGR